MDHLNRPSQSFAAAVREIISWCSTPVIAVARSSHMEDTGFLQPQYSDRAERHELKNLDAAVAEQFAHEIVRRAELSATNISEFLAKVLELSEGNPGAIVSMLEMAKYPKYRTDEHIKITPLYIDLRMSWSPAARSRWTLGGQHYARHRSGSRKDGPFPRLSSESCEVAPYKAPISVVSSYGILDLKTKKVMNCFQLLGICCLNTHPATGGNLFEAVRNPVCFSWKKKAAYCGVRTVLSKKAAPRIN